MSELLCDKFLFKISSSRIFTAQTNHFLYIVCPHKIPSFFQEAYDNGTMMIVPHVKFGFILLFILFLCVSVFGAVKFRLGRVVGTSFFLMYVIFVTYAYLQDLLCNHDCQKTKLNLDNNGFLNVQHTISLYLDTSTCKLNSSLLLYIYTDPFQKINILNIPLAWSYLFSHSLFVSMAMDYKSKYKMLVYCRQGW